jgi:4-carboxymuconolactone decarboxylase
MAKPSDGAKNLIGDFSPKLVELTDRVLFDDVWDCNELSKRDRSLITVAALIALNRPDQLRFHLGRAVENGVKKEELIEAITHLAFYSGWRNDCRHARKRAFRKAQGPMTQPRVRQTGQYVWG